MPPLTDFTFPTYHQSFPPFYTLQPNHQTLTSQLRKWSRLIQQYARHHSLFKLSLPSTIDSPLFKNASLKKRLSLQDAQKVLEWMCKDEGGRRAEKVEGGGSGGGKGGEGGGGAGVYYWIWWKRPEEWGEEIVGWVERTGQKGVVLTLYELTAGEGSRGEEFWGMDGEVLKRALAGLVRKGRAQVFGGEGEEGVKFF